MHERSLVRALLRQVETLLEQQQADRVRAVRVSVGEFSGVEPELFVAAFEEMVEATAARGAELVLQRVPLEARCQGCGCEFAVERFRFECPRCQDRRLTVLRGEDLLLESITMEHTQA